ncbi:MAG TPA: VWA domain-containing protein [Vicinamibacterales bacterium]|nr:VWA domain-containing protein [Vicinamibacterales bacterium]
MRRPVFLVVILLTMVAAWPLAQRGSGTGTGGGRGRGGGQVGGVEPAPQQRPVFRATVELIQVDVVVRDRDGNPVRGLTANDFVILDRRRMHPVATFKEIRRDQQPQAPDLARAFPSTLKLDVASNQTARSERLVVMVLDDLHAYRGRDETVKTIARQVVEDLGPQSTMALVMTSGNNNVDVTEDRSRLLESIEKFKGHRAVRRPMTAPDNRRASDLDILQMFDANLRLYNALRNGARVLAGNDGRRKAFVLISENIAKDLTGVFALSTPRGDPPPDASDYFLSGDPEALAAIPTPTTPFHDLAILEMMDAMRRGNVATYAIDPRGHVPPQDMLRECMPAFGLGDDPCLGGTLPAWNNYIRQAQHGLEIMSAASGGFAVVNTNDFTAGVRRIMADLDNYYLLGFYPDDLNSKGYRRLEVQVKGRADVTLRYRRGYELGREVVENKKVEPIFALSTNALPTTDLPLRLHAVAMPGSGASARVPIALEVTVPVKQVQESDASVQDDIRFGVLVVDMNGAKVKQQVGRGARMVLRPRDPSLPPPDTVTYQIGLAIDLNPGRYQLRASALSTKIGQGGSVFLPFDVPDYSKVRLALSGLVIGYAGGARVPVFASEATARGRGMPPGRAAPAPPPSGGRTPTVPGGLPFPPSLDREFHVSDDVALYFEVARKDKARDVETAIAVVDAADRIVKRYSQTMPASSTGKVTFRLPLSEIGVGTFRVRVTASDTVNDAMSEVGIIVK